MTNLDYCQCLLSIPVTAVPLTSSSIWSPVLIAYAYPLDKPPLSISDDELQALPKAAFYINSLNHNGELFEEGSRELRSPEGGEAPLPPICSPNFRN